MHPAVAKAIQVHRAINSTTPKISWASLEIIFFGEDTEPVVRMEIGHVSFDGIKQTRLVTRNYMLDYSNNEVFWHDHLHS